MTVDAVITGAHVVMPDGIIQKNIMIDEGKITGFGSDEPSCDVRIRADGLIALPGMIDPHVHYGVYSPIDEAARTESHAAAIGGVTTMMRMLRLGGSYRQLLGPQLEASSKTHHVDYAIHASIFTELQIKEMQYCTEYNITSFKIYMNLGSDVGHVYMDLEPGSHLLSDEKVEMDDAKVGRIVEQAAKLRCPVLVHAEDYESCSCGIKEARQKGKDGLGAWSESRSPESEANAISRVCMYARKFGCTIYFVHIGSARALNQINAEKTKGAKIFTETCPHYLVLSHERQQGYKAKVMPPIRTVQDNAALWDALSSKIDTIGTDHVANRLRSKLGGEDVWGALAGFPGVGVAMPLLLSEGVNRQRLSLEQLARLTSTNTAAIFGLSHTKGAIRRGLDADIILADLKLERQVSPDLFGGYSDYSVYDGWRLKGWPVKCLVRGQIISSDFEVTGRPGYGRLARRDQGP